MPANGWKGKTGKTENLIGDFLEKWTLWNQSASHCSQNGRSTTQFILSYFQRKVNTFPAKNVILHGFFSNPAFFSNFLVQFFQRKWALRNSRSSNCKLRSGSDWQHSSGHILSWTRSRFPDRAAAFAGRNNRRTPAAGQGSDIPDSSVPSVRQFLHTESLLHCCRHRNVRQH